MSQHLGGTDVTHVMDYEDLMSVHRLGRPKSSPARSQQQNNLLTQSTQTEIYNIQTVKNKQKKLAVYYINNKINLVNRKKKLYFAKFSNSLNFYNLGCL